MNMRLIVICGLPRSKIVLRIISKTIRFSKKKIIEHRMRVLIFYKFLSELFSILRRNERDMIKNVYRPSSKETEL